LIGFWLLMECKYHVINICTEAAVFLLILGNGEEAIDRSAVGTDHSVWLHSDCCADCCSYAAGDSLEQSSAMKG
jgi:hypothetical protein